MEWLRYRAGAAAIERLRNQGLSKEALRVLVLPAVGPRWLVTTGIDRALVERGWLGDRRRRLLLLGASVGAWRALALAAPDPLRAQRALIDEYCSKHFTSGDDPGAITQSYAELLAKVFSDEDLAHALRNPDLDLGVTAVRAGNLSGSNTRLIQSAMLAAAALLNGVSPRLRRVFFERTLFHTRAGRPDEHPVLATLEGLRLELTPRNVRAVALASGTVPLYMEPVRSIADAPDGAYLDGALSDYHLNQPMHELDGVALLLLHDARIIPSWLDKFLPWRRTVRHPLSDLIVCHPSPEFIRSLPGGTVPSRDDFERFVDRPDERFARWREVVARAEQLGEAFFQDVESGAIAARARAL